MVEHLLVAHALALAGVDVAVLEGDPVPALHLNSLAAARRNCRLSSVGGALHAQAHDDHGAAGVGGGVVGRRVGVELGHGDRFVGQGQPLGGTTCARAVRQPCPISTVPVNSTALPSELSLMDADATL